MMLSSYTPLMTSRSSIMATLAAVLLIILFGWPVLTQLREALTRAHWFHLTSDEALHGELIEKLAQTGSYGQWASEPFAPNLTTGPAVIVPAAAISALTSWPAARTGR